MRALLAGAAVVALVAGCGSNELTYVGNADSAGMYFTVPSGWHAYDSKALTAAEAAWGGNEAGKAILDSTTWQAAFDASPTPSLEHVFANVPADAPTAFASVRTLYDAEKQEKAEDPTMGLRDLVLPVSTLETQARDDFVLDTDERIEQSTFQGRHLVFRYRESADGPEQTVDQTAYLDPGGTKVYLMVVRCTTACFDAHRAAITSAVSSLTLKEVRGG